MENNACCAVMGFLAHRKRILARFQVLSRTIEVLDLIAGVCPQGFRE
ncbi:MAG TPA: hypothetical protein PLC35_09845 [Methanosarcina vacuolata]|nr:hypothetical protein [Methanosarcina sp. DH1]MCC4766960.1 hypothetical protein [Methanosarcina sp. DH1]HPS90257.1 hypothetical protein [Methanosarcina vacuolata]